MKVITFKNKKTGEVLHLTLDEAIKKLRECFSYPKSNNNELFKDIQHVMRGELLQNTTYIFSALNDPRIVGGAS